MGQGIYYGALPSEIDFRSIRLEYGREKGIDTINEYRESLEGRFKIYKKLLNEDISESIKNSVTDAIYGEFGTGEYETFLKRLRKGLYDKGFDKACRKEDIPLPEKGRSI